MEVRLESITSRQAVTPIQATASTLRKPADEPAENGGGKAAHTLAVTPIEERVQTLHRELRFRVDETTGLTVVRVVEAETGDLIRQIPSQTVLDMHALRDSARGQLLREQA